MRDGRDDKGQSRSCAVAEERNLTRLARGGQAEQSGDGRGRVPALRVEGLMSDQTVCQDKGPEDRSGVERDFTSLG